MHKDFIHPHGKFCSISLNNFTCFINIDQDLENNALLLHSQNLNLQGPLIVADKVRMNSFKKKINFPMPYIIGQKPVEILELFLWQWPPWHGVDVWARSDPFDLLITGRHTDIQEKVGGLVLVAQKWPNHMIDLCLECFLWYTTFTFDSNPMQKMWKIQKSTHYTL